jgi:fumarylacetoacetate (FAA) hydrolase
MLRSETLRLKGQRMKLASLKGGRDGRLVVVSDDLAYFAYAGHIATTLQDVLDNWEMLAPKLELLATDLAHGVIPRERFHERDAASPLSRAFGWIADGAIQSAGGFLGPRDPVLASGAAQSGVAVVTGDVPRGTSAADCAGLVRLVGLSLTCGTVTSFSPVFVTPESLGSRWSGGALDGTLNSDVDGQPQSRAETGSLPDFGALVAQAAESAAVCAGTIIGSGSGSGFATTPGQTLRVWVDNDKKHPIFGVIEQRIG